MADYAPGFIATTLLEGTLDVDTLKALDTFLSHITALDYGRVFAAILEGEIEELSDEGLEEKHRPAFEAWATQLDVVLTECRKLAELSKTEEDN